MTDQKFTAGRCLAKGCHCQWGEPPFVNTRQWSVQVGGPPTAEYQLQSSGETTGTRIQQMLR